MEISQSFAMEMVKELSEILHQHINFMNKEAIIIASTDESRISSCHMGAKKLIEEQLPFLSIDSDEEFIGSKKGLNLPIVVDDQIVGVIGVTGDPRQVSKYGQLLKKFTEMYIRDERIRQMKNQEDKIVSRFLEKWLLDPQHASSPTFKDTAISLGIDPNQQYRIVMMMYSNHTTSSADIQQKFDLSTRYFKSQLLTHGNHYCRLGSKMIYLLSSDDEKIKKTLFDLRLKVLQSYGVSTNIGFDRGLTESVKLHQHYIEASKSLKASSQFNEGVVGFADLYLELFLDDVSTVSRQRFIEKVFFSMSKTETEEAIFILKSYYRHNGSTSMAADELFIHKNTLQYKLQRIATKTLLDPRMYHNIPLFSLAILFFEEEVQENKSIAHV